MQYSLLTIYNSGLIRATGAFLVENDKSFYPGLLLLQLCYANDKSSAHFTEELAAPKSVENRQTGV